ncbi:MAG: Cytochrome [Phycisphaerales bacterium]|nr:Cytochrome [Phycisphaerales bacterium]
MPGRLVYRMSRDIVGFFADIQKTYGDLAYFRLGRRRIYLLSHPDHIRDVLVTRADNFTKGPALRMAKVTLGEGLLTSEGDFHRRQRRLMQPAFHAQRVMDYAGVFVDYALRARERWRAGEVFDVRAAMTQLTLEIVAKTLFDAEIESEVRELGEAMDVTVTMFDRSRYPWARLLNLLPLKSNMRFLRAKDRVFQTIDRMIAQRRAEGPAGYEGRKDFLSILLRARDPEGDGRGMSDEQLRYEAMTLFSAGHETTANAMVWTWLLLSQNPEAEAKLHEELARELSGHAPTAADVPRLTYTRAVLAESMRLYSPAWIVGRQATAAHRVGQWTIPAGGVILMAQHIVHRDVRWWDRPEAFEPQRWLGEQPERPRYAYFPFGGGPRQCIGESFAWLEGILLIATLAQRWRFVRVDQEPVRLHATITMRPRDALPMRVEEAVQHAGAERRER